MRLIGVDYGFSRIGIAVGESETSAFGVRKPLAASGVLKRDAAAIADLANKEEANLVLVGLPLTPEGEEGKMARICRRLAAELELLGRETRLVDERLTSKQAETQMYEAGLRASQRRKLIDGEAAVLILERYLHAEASS